MLWIIIIMSIFALDRITKFIILKNIGFDGSITIIDGFFYLIHSENRGAAWGILPNGRYFFIVLTMIIGIIISYSLYKSNNNLLKAALTFILGGAAGNLTDRIFRGRVTDFLNFYFGSYNFPTFNVSDSFVVIGTFLLAFYLLFIHKEKKSQ